MKLPTLTVCFVMALSSTMNSQPFTIDTVTIGKACSNIFVDGEEQVYLLYEKFSDANESPDSILQDEIIWAKMNKDQEFESVVSLGRVFSPFSTIGATHFSNDGQIQFLLKFRDSLQFDEQLIVLEKNQSSVIHGHINPEGEVTIKELIRYHFSEINPIFEFDPDGQLYMVGHAKISFQVDIYNSSIDFEKGFYLIEFDDQLNPTVYPIEKNFDTTAVYNIAIGEEGIYVNFVGTSGLGYPYIIGYMNFQGKVRWDLNWFSSEYSVFKVDSEENLYITTSFLNVFKLGSDILVEPIDFYDSAVFSIDSEGNINWYQIIGGIGDEDDLEMIEGPNGNYLYFGDFSDEQIWGDSIISDNFGYLFAEIDKNGTILQVHSDSIYHVEYLPGFSFAPNYNMFSSQTAVYLVKKNGSTVYLKFSYDDLNTTDELGLQSRQLKIYPNPSIDQLEVIWDGENSIHSYFILNNLGQRLQSGMLDNQIDIYDLPLGAYFLFVQNQKQEILATKKFIKGM